MTSESSQKLSQLKLLLRPECDDLNRVKNLAVNLVFADAKVSKGDVLFTVEEPVPKHVLGQWQAGVPVLDNSGHLELYGSRSNTGTYEWRVARGAVGDVVLKWSVTALHKEGSTSPSDLQMDDGGFIGVGGSFIPLPGGGNAQYQSVVEWDLSATPPGTRAVCSFGEGPEPVAKNGSASTLVDTVYMVGPVRSYPPEKATPSAMYWFGNLPPNLDTLAEFHTNMFPRMAAHFQNPDGSYHVFLRRTSDGFKGRNFSGCSILDYDEATHKVSDYDLVRWLTRHMVLNWVGLDAEDDGSLNNWYSEGIAHLYSIYLPFRFGQRTGDYFKATVNTFLMAYYTNPQIGISIEDSGTRVDWYAGHVLPFRACVYILKTDSHTRRASRDRNAGVLRPIDEIIAAISVHRRAGGKVQRKAWLHYLAGWIGEADAETRFRDMMAGKVMELGDMKSSFGDIHEPVAMDQEVLCWGMDPASFEKGLVHGLVAGSRAEIAGLSEGLAILSHTRLGSCVTNFRERMEVVVERNGQKTSMAYWPRDWKTATSWQVMQIAERGTQ